jgi:hypothetical protein
MVAEVKSYQVTATPEDRFWLLVVPELDVVTQSRTLDRAEPTVRDLIATWLDVPADSFEVVVEPRLDPEYERLVEEAKRARQDARSAQASATRRMGDAVHRLRQHGLAPRDISAIVDLSYQRVQQILSDTDATGLRR